MIFGITHNLDGSPIRRLPKSVKVGIGYPRGKGVNVFLAPLPANVAQKLGAVAGTIAWAIQYTVSPQWKDAKTQWYLTRESAEEDYPKIRNAATVIDFPGKLPYFTFLRLENEEYVHDFEAIAAHGPKPTEIGIIFTTDNPFETKMANWSASELRCFGDGKTGQRLVKLAATPEEKTAAAEAVASGSKWFTVDVCRTGGCSYSRPTERMVNGKPKAYPPECKPSGDLTFQLINNFRLGGRAYLHTGGEVSIAQTHSALDEVGSLTGGLLTGIPFRLIVKPFKTNHNGIPGKAYAIHVEAYENAQAGKAIRKILDQASGFRQIAGVAGLERETAAVPRLAAAPMVELGSGLDVDESDGFEGLQESAAVAKNMADEFYHETTAEAPVTVSDRAAASTEAASEQLAQALAQSPAHGPHAVNIRGGSDSPPETVQSLKAYRINQEELKQQLQASVVQDPAPPPTAQTSAPPPTSQRKDPFGLFKK